MCLKILSMSTLRELSQTTTEKVNGILCNQYLLQEGQLFEDQFFLFQIRSKPAKIVDLKEEDEVKDETQQY